MSRSYPIAFLFVGLALFLATPAAASSPRPLGDGARGDRARLVATKALSALASRDGRDDSQWYANGVWHLKATPCWPCTVGPATLAATLWRVDGRRDSTHFN